MYKELFKVKGINLTGAELKEAYSKDFDNAGEMFEDVDLNEPAVKQFGGFVREESGYTVMYVEEA